MTNTEITGQDIKAAVAALPELPTVIANTMMFAQSYEPTRVERAAIDARREFFRWVGMPTNVNVPVRDEQGGLIGHLVFVR